nr:helix-turn-helix domain-containing protein [uncultured Romboutsia sp.]
MKEHKIMNYKHITINERCCIANFLDLGWSIIKIAKHLNRNASTISREIRRNSINEKYLAHIANETYINNKMNCEAKGKSSNNKLIDALC